MSARSRVPASSKPDVVRILAGYLNTTKQIQHAESGDEPIDRRTLLSHRSLLDQLLEVGSSYNQSLMRSSLKAVAKSKGKKWCPKDEMHDFGDAVARRIRTMLRHWKQAQVHQATWQSKVSDVGDFMVGWDKEFGKAWRQKPNGKKQYTNKDMLFIHDDHAEDTDSIWAKWPDNFVHEVPEVSVGMYRAMQTSTSGIMVETPKPRTTKPKKKKRGCHDLVWADSRR